MNKRLKYVSAPSLRMLIVMVLGAWSASVAAGIIGFTYTGIDPTCSTCSATGTGSFSFADSPTSVGLGDLTSFSFTQTYTDTSVPVAGTFNYSLLDLLSFAATLDLAQNLTALALETKEVRVTSGEFLPQSFKVTSLASAETEICSQTKGGNECLQVTAGSISTSAVPEPATLFLLIIAAAGLIGHVFRSREVAPI